MQKLLVLTLSLWLCSFSESRSNNPAREGLKWLSLKEASTKVKAENKLILIDLYTDWCSWCKVMDKNTYTNKELIKYVNEKFYAVKLNAETRETISWLGKDFTYDDRYKVNTYALYLTQGQLAFPTTVIIPADGSAPQAIPGYLKPQEMELVLKYFGENRYGKQPFQDFQNSFKASW
jgi:thioredoxin-related protein